MDFVATASSDPITMVSTSNLLGNDDSDKLMICYYYYPRIAYWIIVCAASAIIMLISYLSLYAICCKVNPFQRWLGGESEDRAEENEDENEEEEDGQRKAMESVIRFYQFMFGITVILLIFSILISTVLSKLCFDGVSNLFEEQYVAAILVLISYVMVSMTLNLLWFSTNSSENRGLCRVVAIMFGIAVLIHFSGIGMLCYWMKVEEPELTQTVTSFSSLQAYYNNQLNNTAILLMVVVTTVTYTTFWVFICRIFKYRFCCKKRQQQNAQTLTANELNVQLV